MKIEIGLRYLYKGPTYAHTALKKIGSCDALIEIVTEIDENHIYCECINCKRSFKYIKSIFFEAHTQINKSIVI